jgi:UDP-glucose 4-epimerase
MSNILVTGGAGFVGSNLVKRLKNKGHNILVIDNYSAGKRENEVPGVYYVKAHTKNIVNYQLDYLSQHKTRIDFEPEVVFHLGEYSRIHPSFAEYDLVWQYNTVGTFEVVNFCKSKNIKLIYAASSTRFAKEGIDHSPYSLTKSMSIDLVKAFAKWYGLQYSICYFYNVFGPGYDSSPVKGYESVISVFEKQYRDNKPITVSGDGLQERMFTYVDDIVDGLIKAWHYPTNDEFDLVNLNRSYTILEIAKMFSDNIQFIEARKGDRSNSAPQNYQETCDKLDWHPTATVEDWINMIKNQ